MYVNGSDCGTCCSNFQLLVKLARLMHGSSSPAIKVLCWDERARTQPQLIWFIVKNATSQHVCIF